MSDREDVAFVLVAGVYVAGLVTANAIAAKLIDFAGMVFSVGAIAYPVTFVLQDVINEHWGPRRARAVVWAAFLGAAVMVLYTVVAVAVEESDARPLHGAFEAIFAPTPRIVAASLVGFVVGGLVDVRVFFRVRRLTGGRYLWLRKVTSTLVSQGVDTALFVFIAFAWSIPWWALTSMAIGMYLFKQAIAIGALPVSYTVLGVLRCGSTSPATNQCSSKPW